MAASEAADDECASMCAGKQTSGRIVVIALAPVAVVVVEVGMAVTYVFISSL